MFMSRNNILCIRLAPSLGEFMRCALTLSRSTLLTVPRALYSLSHSLIFAV